MTLANHPDVVKSINALYDLIILTSSGLFYVDYDAAVDVLSRATQGFEYLQETIGWDAEDYPDEKEMQLRSLIAKIAPAVFDESEGGGHDLGLWLDCGDITEDEYLILREVLGQ